MFVRWDILTVERGRRRAGSRATEDAVVRRFDAPEALDTRFHEVHAKSALNRVPDAVADAVPLDDQSVPGMQSCLHLLPVGRHAGPHGRRADPAARRICGSATRSTGRSATAATAATCAPRCSTTGRRSSRRTGSALEDGTELSTSGDHRFLTERGWKHVTDSSRVRPDRPHLTLNNKLMGHRALRRPAARSRERLPARLPLRPDPRRRAPRHATRTPRPSGRTAASTASGWRSPTSRRCAARSDSSSELGVDDRRVRRSRAAVGDHRADARRSAPGARADVRARSARSSRWPLVADEATGARGSSPGSSTPRARCSARVAADLATPTAISSTGRTESPRAARVRLRRRGLRPAERLRSRAGPRRAARSSCGSSTLTTRRSRASATIEGTALKSDAKLRVVAIEPLGMELPLYDITTGTGDFIANGVVSHNCFARPTHEYLDFNAGRDFEKRDRRQGQRARGAAGGAGAAVVEGRARRAGDEHRPVPVGRGALQADARDLGGAARRAQPVLGPDEVAAAAARPRPAEGDRARSPTCSAYLSVPTLDEKAWRASEPHTPHPRKRLEAVAELNRAGIPTGVLIAPLMPGINDAPEQVRRSSSWRRRRARPRRSSPPAPARR